MTISYEQGSNVAGTGGWGDGGTSRSEIERVLNLAVGGADAKPSERLRRAWREGYNKGNPERTSMCGHDEEW